MNFGLERAEDVSTQEINLYDDQDMFGFVDAVSVKYEVEILDDNNNWPGKLNPIIASLGKENAINVS